MHGNGGNQEFEAFCMMCTHEKSLGLSDKIRDIPEGGPTLVSRSSARTPDLASSDVMLSDGKTFYHVVKLSRIGNVGS